MVERNDNPPLSQNYAELVRISGVNNAPAHTEISPIMKECELPIIDLAGLKSDIKEERYSCREAICTASSEWGFFQVVNHGISLRLLQNMRNHQLHLFQSPFQNKSTSRLFNNSYRWGNTTATCPDQFSWSEAFHVPLDKISDQSSDASFDSLMEVMQEYASSMQGLAKVLAGVLVTNLGHKEELLDGICDESTCFLRLNRYPACPISSEIFGLVPHTDSDFLTILHQDEVGGLQLMKDSKWVAVKPNQNTLIVNIGDLFQAWSNDVYKSVEHKVIVNAELERYSIAYFLCPSYESKIGSCKEPPVYSNFTFGEYRRQIQQDVKNIGQKIGLPRFLLQNQFQ